MEQLAKRGARAARVEVAVGWLALSLGGCSGHGGDASSSDGSRTGSGAASSGDPSTTSASATTGMADPSSGTSEADSSSGGEPVEPECAVLQERVPDDPPAGYGFTTEPPQMALADTFYTYDVRTQIGACSTDRVRWTFESGPAGAWLELGTHRALAPGATTEINDGGAVREAAKVALDLHGVEPGCYAMTVSWQAWRDCGLSDPGGWGPAVRQEFEVAVRPNRWYSGDLHVHTRHSERGDEAGGARDYYRRMINEVADDAGNDYASRRLRSLRGRLHWLVFSDHTNNEYEECGRHFSAYCAAGESAEIATGRDVVREITAADPSTLLVVGAEVSNRFDGHFGVLPENPYPGDPIYAPGYFRNPTTYDHDFGFGPGVFPERWIVEDATNAEELDQIHQLGALAIVNHESGVAFWVEYDWTSLDIDGLEVWNGGNRHDQDDDSAYHGGLDVNTIVENDVVAATLPEDPLYESYIGMLKTGRWPFSLVGGSDTHDYNEIVCGGAACDPLNAELASPATSVWADTFVWANGSDGVFDGLARGRVTVHDKSNFIDLRVRSGDTEFMVGDTVAGYEPGAPLTLAAFGRVSDYIDGDNRVLLVLGTSGDPDDRHVDVLYNSASGFFVEEKAGTQEMRRIRPDSSFDRRRTFTLDAAKFGKTGTYFVWAQFVPWHNPIYAFGNGQDMALTGVVRVRSTR